MNRKSRLRTGLVLLLVIGIVVFYEYRIREYKKITYLECYQLKDGFTIFKGQELNKNMFKVVKVDKAILPADYIKNESGVNNKVALENIFPKDILRDKKVADKKEWYKNNERIIWLSCEDDKGVAANDLRPGDSVDIFIFNKELNKYVLDKDFTGLLIQDLKDKDSVKYMDSKNASFIIKDICFKMDNPKYEKLVNMLQPDNKFQVTIHGNRPKIERSTKTNTSVIENLTQ